MVSAIEIVLVITISSCFFRRADRGGIPNGVRRERVTTTDPHSFFQASAMATPHRVRIQPDDHG